MRKTYILGAGFSKAIANAPTQREIWTYIDDVYREFINRSDIPNDHKKNRISWYHQLNNFINKLEELSLERFSNISNDYEYIETEIRENLEYLLTFIDLHIHAPKIKFFKKGTDTEPYPLIPIKETNKRELESIRGILNTYLYLVFEKLEGNAYASKFAKSLLEGSVSLW